MNKTQINKNEEINLIRADENDAQRLYEMQKMAFADLFFKYKDFETSPYCEPVAKTIFNLANSLDNIFTFFQVVTF